MSTGNLEVLSRFYERNPDYVDKTFLSMKSGIIMIDSIIARRGFTSPLWCRIDSKRGRVQKGESAA